MYPSNDPTGRPAVSRPRASDARGADWESYCPWGLTSIVGLKANVGLFFLHNGDTDSLPEGFWRRGRKSVRCSPAFRNE